MHLRGVCHASPRRGSKASDSFSKTVLCPEEYFTDSEEPRVLVLVSPEEGNGEGGRSGGHWESWEEEELG